MASSVVLRAVFIIISTTIIFYATSEAYLIKYRPPYDSIYLQAVRELLKRQVGQSVRGHIPPEPAKGGEVLQLPTDKNTGIEETKKEYSLANLKLDDVKDILKVDVIELYNELPPAYANK